MKALLEAEFCLNAHSLACDLTKIGVSETLYATVLISTGLCMLDARLDRAGTRRRASYAIKPLFQEGETTREPVALVRICGRPRVGRCEEAPPRLYSKDG